LAAPLVGVVPIAIKFFAVLGARRSVRVKPAALLLVAVFFLVKLVAFDLFALVPTQVDILVPIAPILFLHATLRFVVPFAFWNCTFGGATVHISVPFAHPIPDGFVQACLFVVHLGARHFVAKTGAIVKPWVPFALVSASLDFEKGGASFVSVTTFWATFVQRSGEHLVFRARFRDILALG
jgi:hypothetical protein